MINTKYLKNMKTITLSLVLVAISFSLYAQDFEVPENFNPEKAEDYAPYEQEVIKCFDWLMSTPLNENPAKRTEVNGFLLKWLTGSPTVHLEIKQEIVTFMGTSPDLLMIFLGGWAKFSLESKEFDDNIAGSLAGIESVIAFYVKNKDLLPKDKHIEKYIKLKNKGTLKNYIEKNA